MSKTIHIIGNLTRDPEVRVSQAGKTICNMNVAVNSVTRKRMPDGSYNNEKTADYFRVTVFGTEAENCGKYLKKGRKVAVHGELSISIARDGNGKVIYRKDVDNNPTDEPLINLDLQAEGRVEFLSNLSPDESGSAGTAPATAAPAEAAPAPAPAPVPVDVPDDELPF